jgi:CBS domain-containing protein
MTTVRDVLIQKGGVVHHIHPTASVLSALKMMAEHSIGALVVIDNGHLAGIVSERDYARKIVLRGRTSPNSAVQDIMSNKVICARLDQTVQECMAVMTARAVRHLPVLESKKVVGIVSIGDLVKSIIAEEEFIIEQLEHYIQGDL